MEKIRRWLTALLALCVLVVSITPQTALAAAGTVSESTDYAVSSEVVDEEQDDESQIYEETTSGTQADKKSIAEDTDRVSAVSMGEAVESDIAGLEISSESVSDNRNVLSKEVGVQDDSVMSLSSPEMVSASYNTEGLVVRWTEVSDAEGYIIYRKIGSDGTWEMLAYSAMGSTEYIDATTVSGKTYFYTVAAYNADYVSTYGDSIVEGSGSCLETPTLNTATASASGTTISWSEVDGASGYTVYRKKSGGSWSQIGYTTSTSYTDTASLSSGSTYYYTVRAYTGDYETVTATENKYKGRYWSYFDTEGLRSVYLAVPSLNSTATASASGTTVSWSKVTGATGYAVYRKISGGSWGMIATTTSTSYTDTASLTGGSTYYYTVRAYVGGASNAKEHRYDAAYWGGYNTTGVKSVYLAVPSLKTATAGASGTGISWSKVSGATGYAVYRKKSGGSWSMIGTTTSTSYTDKSSLSGGATYYYTVRAYKGSVSTAKSYKYNAVYWGGYNTTGSKSVYLANPSLSSAAVTSSKYIKVTWSAVTGAKGYAVYRKVSGGSWSMIATTTSTSYTDKQTLTSGKTYYYTVRAYTGSLSTAKSNKYSAVYWSGYNSTGVKFDYIKNSDGTLVYDKTMYNKAQSRSSSTKWLILVDCTSCKVGIFYGSKGSWDMKYYWSCTPGKASTPTVTGEFTVKSKGKSFGTSTYTCWYYTQFYGNYLFHSVLYYPNSMTEIKDGRLGQNLSHGCVRLSLTNAKWIYDNIPTGTKVYIY